MRVLAMHNGHDASCALAVDGAVVVYIEEERLNGLKHGFNLHELNERRNTPHSLVPWLSVDYCLQAASLRIDDLDAVVITNFNPYLSRQIPIEDKSKIVFAPAQSHHLLHAYATFAASGFDRAAVLVADGSGSLFDDRFEAESGYVLALTDGGSDGAVDVRPIFKNTYPLTEIAYSGLGMMYAAVSQLLGFYSPASGLDLAGKTMGLAAYGTEDPDLEPLVTPAGADFALDFGGFERFLLAEQLLTGTLGSVRVSIAQAKYEFTEFERSLAFHVQRDLETAMLHVARRLREVTGERRLCMAGGVALNSVANANLVRRAGYDDIYVLPNCGDGGNALGALAWHASERRAVGSWSIDDSFYLGRAYGEGDVVAAIGNLPAERLTDEQLAARIAEFVVRGEVVAVCRGGSEAGPRALGARSILASPAEVAMRDHLNIRVKLRETFRPYAPIVPAELAAEWFEISDSAYMLKVSRIVEGKERYLPAVSHADNTARVQTLQRSRNQLIYDALVQVGERCGVPILINTSFNIKGMPIVESPRDAVEAFLTSEIDRLVLGNFVVSRLDELSIPLVPVADYRSRLGELYAKHSRQQLLDDLCSDLGCVKQTLFSNLDELLANSEGRTIRDFAVTAPPGSPARSTVDALWRRLFITLRREGIIRVA